MIIYADVIFIENILMNYIILYICAKGLKIKIKNMKLIISSLIGSIYVISILFFKIDILQGIFCKILLSLIMIIIAFNPKKIKKCLIYLAMFYVISFAFGGTSFAMMYFINPKNIIVNNGMYVRLLSL